MRLHKYLFRVLVLIAGFLSGCSGVAFNSGADFKPLVYASDDRPHFQSVKEFLLYSTLRAEEANLESLARIANLSEYDLQNLKYKTLVLSDLSFLTVDEARMLSFVGARDYVLLNGLTELSPELAEAVVRIGGRELVLSGVSSISTEVAGRLREFSGGELYLDGIKELDPETARALLGNRLSLDTLDSATFGVSLDGLHQLPVELARMIVSHYRPWDAGLGLAGLEAISGKAAEHLGHFRGDKLDLSGLKALSPEAARGLSKYRGQFSLDGVSFGSEGDTGGYYGSLYLDGLNDLSEAAAGYLAQFQGDVLSLNGVTELKEPIAKILSKILVNELRLDGVKELSPAAAAHLAAFSGKKLSLNGLVTVNAELLKCSKKVNLGGLKTIAPELVPELVKLVNGWGRKKRLHFDSLEILPLELLASLQKFDGALVTFNGAKTISVDVAEAIGKLSSRKLSLAGVTHLSTEVTQEIAKFQGESIAFGALDAASIRNVATFVGLGAKFKVTMERGSMSSADAESILALPKAEQDYLAPAMGSVESLLSDLSPSLASALCTATKSRSGSNYSGYDRVEFSKVSNLSPETAASMASCVRSLSFPKLQRLSVEVLEALQTYQGDRVVLRVEPQISPEQAQAIAALSVKELTLLGLKVLSEESAKALSSFAGKLILDSLVRFDGPAATAFAGFKGITLKMPNIVNIDSQGLSALAQLTSAGKLATPLTHILPNFRALTADDLTVLASVDEKFRRQALSDWSDFRELSPAIVKEMPAGEIGGVRFGHLSHLDVLSARALVEHQPKRNLLDFVALSSAESGAIEILTQAAYGEFRFHQLRRVSPDTAQALSAFKGDALSFYNLDSLEPDAAKHLAGYTGALTLVVRTLSPESIRELAKYQGRGIELNILTQTNETMAALLRAGLPVKLNRPMREITPDLARAIIEMHEERENSSYLELKQLESLSVESANVLSQFQGETMELYDFDSISPEALAALSEFKGEVYIRGLRSRPFSLFGAWAKFGERIKPSAGTWLRSLDAVDEDMAKEIATHWTGAGITLEKVENLSPKAARHLAQFQGKGDGSESWLSLKGLKNFNVEVLKELSKSKATQVFIPQLGEFIFEREEITHELADIFVALKLKYLPSLRAKTISASALGRLCDLGQDLTFQGLESVSMLQAKAIAKCADRVELWLPSLPDDSVLKLMGQMGLKSLVINNLANLTTVQAKLIAEFKGKSLELGSVDSLNIEMVRLLAQSQVDKLGLGFKTLRPEQADVLSTHFSGVLALPSMEEISAESAMALGKFRGGNIEFRLGEVPKIAPSGILSILPLLSRSQQLRYIHLIEDIPDSKAKDLVDVLNVEHEYRGTLDFSALQTLSPALVKAFRAYKGRVNWAGVATLSSKTLKAMRGTEREWQLSLDAAKLSGSAQRRAFSKIAAKKFRVTFRGFENLTLKDAKWLASLQVDALELRDIKSFSPGAAKALLKFKGGYIGLNKKNRSDFLSETKEIRQTYKGYLDWR